MTVESKFFSVTNKKYVYNMTPAYLSLSHFPHRPLSLYSSHTEKIIRNLEPLAFPCFFVSASRKPSLISFNIISCIHSILEVPLKNLIHYDHFSMFSPLTCGFSEGRDHILCIFVPPDVSNIWWSHMCGVNEWMSHKTQNKIVGTVCLFFLPFHANFTSWETREYFLHPPWNYCLNWHCFLQAQW